MSVQDYLLALTNMGSIEELWSAHCAKMDSYGFDRLIYGFTRYRSGMSLGDPDDFVVLTNHDPAYTATFMGERLYFHAPMTRWALENEGACSWRHVGQLFDNRTLTPEEQRVVSFNLKMQVTAGYTISFRSISPRVKGAIGLTARPGLSQDAVDAIWAEHGADLMLMNNVAHLRIQTLPQTAMHRPLTERQREVLAWVGDGKTAQDIAMLMGVTAATVEKHLRLARETLSVETTAQAVLKAAMENQMFVFET